MSHNNKKEVGSVINKPATDNSSKYNSPITTIEKSNEKIKLWCHHSSIFTNFTVILHNKNIPKVKFFLKYSPLEY